MLILLLLLMMLLLHSPGTKKPKSKVRNSHTSKDEDERKNHSLVTNRLDETVEDFRKRARAHFCPADCFGVLAHASFPIVADDFHGGDAGVAVASVVCEFAGARGHFGEGFGRGGFGGLVDVRKDGGVEGVDYVN